ncbi:hypothetical protein dsx2_3290 [Desulfovibrio sp. X2]|nr:hypothetical protein dsx2_3290 [Desulfovibrio sp. X2]
MPHGPCRPNAGRGSAPLPAPSPREAKPRPASHASPRPNGHRLPGRDLPQEFSSPFPSPPTPSIPSVVLTAGANEPAFTPRPDTARRGARPRRPKGPTVPRRAAGPREAEPKGFGEGGWRGSGNLPRRQPCPGFFRGPSAARGTGKYRAHSFCCLSRPGGLYPAVSRAACEGGPGSAWRREGPGRGRAAPSLAVGGIFLWPYSACE